MERYMTVFGRAFRRPQLSEKSLGVGRHMALLAVSATLCTMPIFIQGLPQDDMMFHIVQADQFIRCLTDGFLVPRWAADLAGGYGSPNFIFYAPLPYYIVALFHLALGSLTAAMKASIWLAFFLSGAAMLFASSKGPDRAAGFLVAVLYQILPFHIFDLTIRGAYSELWAYVWFPLIFWHLRATTDGGGRTHAFFLAVSYAGLVLTHLVSGFICSVAIFGYLLFRAAKSRGARATSRAVASILLGLGLSAYYIMPAVVERQFVNIDHIKNCAVGDYTKNFLFSPDKYSGDLGRFYMPLQAGVIIETALAMVLVLSCGRSGAARTGRFFPVLFFGSLALTTPLSRPLWDAVSSFHFLQFPWRWITMMEVGLCFMLAEELSKKTSPAARRGAVYLGVVFLSMGMVHCIKPSVGPVHPQDDIASMRSGLYVREYLPVWARDDAQAHSFSEQGVTVKEGEASTRILSWEAENRLFEVGSSVPSTIRIATFYYPGWHAAVDGIATPIEVEDGSGAMTLHVPAGVHQVTVFFGHTRLRVVSGFISALACVLAASQARALLTEVR